MSMVHAHHEIAETRYSLLQQRTQAFCAAFLDLASHPPQKILEEHFKRYNPKITEHGPEDECLEYFNLLAETLEFIPSEDTFPGKAGIVVDVNASVGSGHGGEGQGWDGSGVVSVVGKARFKAVKTGKAWDEQFIYRLGEFDEDGKIGHWEIWADPLSAWIAAGGKDVS